MDSYSNSEKRDHSGRVNWYFSPYLCKGRWILYPFVIIKLTKLEDCTKFVLALHWAINITCVSLEAIVLVLFHYHYRDNDCQVSGSSVAVFIKTYARNTSEGFPVWWWQHTMGQNTWYRSRWGQCDHQQTVGFLCLDQYGLDQVIW